MKVSAATAGLLAMLHLVDAHTLFSRLYIDGEEQGDGTCIRMPQDSGSCTNPVNGLTSASMACGKDGEIAAAYVCPTPGSATLTFEFRIWPDAREPGAIDASHVGPCAVYVKPVSDMFSDEAAGPGWTKIWHEGYDDDAGLWCTEKLNNNDGLLSVELPSGLPPGYYLVRPELLGLHQAASKGDPQYYVGCAQIYIKDGPKGSLDVPSEYSVSIPGYIDGSESGNTFDIWKPEWPYIVPGPEPYSPKATESSSGLKSSEIDGVIPSDCLIKNANWCGRPLDKYSDHNGCFAAVEQCFKQGSECYASTSPTGVDGCDRWREDMCHAIQDACESGDYNGPPDVELESVKTSVPGSIPEAVNKRDAEHGEASPVHLSSSGSGDQNLSGDEDDDEERIEDEQDDEDGPGNGESYLVSAGSGDGIVEATSVSATFSLSSSTKPEYDEEDLDIDAGTGRNLIVSPNGTCGGETGFTCIGSDFGDCCSRKGRCGSRKRSCGCGCQSAFGRCTKK